MEESRVGTARSSVPVSGSARKRAKRQGGASLDGGGDDGDGRDGRDGRDGHDDDAGEDLSVAYFFFTTCTEKGCFRDPVLCLRGVILQE